MLLDKVNEVKIKLSLGYITHEEAINELKPVVKQANEKSKEIAKKYNVRAKKISVNSLLR